MMTKAKAATNAPATALPLRTLTIVVAMALVLPALARPAAAASEKTIYAFPESGVNGCYPDGTLLRDVAGALYGATVNCGGSISGSSGTLFKLTPTASGGGEWTFSPIVTSGSDPSQQLNAPNADLVMDGSGALYGTTFGDASSDQGKVFKLTPGSGQWTETVPHAFYYDPLYNRLDGQGPNAGVIKDANGILYGTTSSGGSADNLRGFGTVFKLKPAADETQWYETILYRFQGGADGESPSQALTLDAAGALYGTTNGGTGTCTDPVDGGVSSCGTVFELTPAPGHPMWTKTTLYTFTGGTDGGKPYAKLLLDASGALYGTTLEGGDGQCKADPYYGPVVGCGTVFKLTPPASGSTEWTKSVLYNFKGFPDGAYPEGGLIADEAGNLYGTTWQGGTGRCPDANGLVAGCGVVFKLTPAPDETWTESVLYSFETGSLHGEHPIGGLVADPDGNLFGVTLYGGNKLGTVFEISP